MQKNKNVQNHEKIHKNMCSRTKIITQEKFCQRNGPVNKTHITNKRNIKEKDPVRVILVKNC